MKRIIMGLLISGLFILTACGQSTPALQATPQPDLPTTTSSPLPTTTPTRTALPSATPTASITPLPTIPTFTPTFDVSTIVTVTPAPKADCPTIQENESLDIINYEKGFTTVIIDALNQGIPVERITTALDKGISEYYGMPGLKRARYQMQDLTNDGVSEIVLEFVAFYIIGCHNSKYEILLELPPDGSLLSPSTTSFRDVNRDGIPDITLLLGVASQGGHSYGVYEWDGDKFANIIFSDDPKYPESGLIWAETTGDIHYEDTNRDFVQELILDSGIPVWDTYYSGLPWRNKRTIYMWNGSYYIPNKVEFAAPEFRFQATQDGDLATNQSEFDKALSLYQDTIFSDKLKYYSVDIQKNLQANWMARVGNIRSTPTPYPNDFTEYPRLAAYAYYRIILLHLVQEHESDANTVYNTLQEKFSNDPYGHPYVEMATAFWEAFQSTHKMYAGCAAAIQYAAEHPDILTPLGSDYHGWQSHQYKPEDVCPFR